MDTNIMIILLTDLVLIALLPRLFFRRDGVFNFRWLLTALPFPATAITLLAGYAGMLVLPGASQLFQPVLSQLAMGFGLAALFLIAFTLGSHRQPLALWHQKNDAPANIVTWGAYKYIRHPFYSAFLLTLLGGVLYMPHITTVGLLVYAACLLWWTARREERFLLDSEFGDEYAEYMQRTGRFLPVIRKD